MLGQRLSVIESLALLFEQYLCFIRNIRSLRSIQGYHARCWRFLDSRRDFFERFEGWRPALFSICLPKCWCLKCLNISMLEYRPGFFCHIFWRPLFLDCLSSLVRAEHLRWKGFKACKKKQARLICPSWLIMLLWVGGSLCLIFLTHVWNCYWRLL